MSSINFRISTLNISSEDEIISQLQSELKKINFKNKTEDKEEIKETEIDLKKLLEENNLNPLEKLILEIKKDSTGKENIISLIKEFIFNVAKNLSLTVWILTQFREDKTLIDLCSYISKIDSTIEENKYIFQRYLDYENSFFILGEYMSINDEFLYKSLESSIKEHIVFLFPSFSICLHSLSKNFKIESAEMLLKFLMSNKMELSTCAINNLISSFCIKNQFEKAQSVLETLIDYKPEYLLSLENIPFKKFIPGIGINVVSYGTFIKYLCKEGNLELANYYYEEIKGKGMLKDTVIFNLLIDGYSKQGDHMNIRRIYSDMINLSIKPSIVTFNTIIDSFVRINDILSAWKMFEELINNKIDLDNFTLSTLFRGIRSPNHKPYLLKALEIVYNMINLPKEERKIDTVLINIILDSCASMKEKNIFIEIFNKICNGEFPEIFPDLVTYNTFIKGCSQMKLKEEVIKAYEYMKKDKNIVLDNVTFNSLIDSFVRNKDMTKAWDIFVDMKNYGIKPDNITYSTLIKGLSKGETEEEINEDSPKNNYGLKIYKNDFKTVLELFEKVRSLNQVDEVFYNSIMDACLRFKKYDKMFEIYDTMINDDIKPSSVTYGILIKGYGLKGDLKSAMKVFQIMKNERINITSVTYGSIINTCIQNDNLSKAFEYFEELKNSGIEINTILYTTIIKAYAKINNLNKVLETFNEMKKTKETYPSTVTYNTIIDFFFKIGNISLADNAFNEMLNSKDIHPDLVSFSTMIKGYFKNNCYDKAISTLDALNNFKIKPDLILLNTILDGCEKIKKYDKALEIFHSFRKEGVEPNTMTYSIIMKIYGILNDFKNSKELMEEAKANRKNYSLILYTCFIKTCLNSLNLTEAINSFNELKSINIIPDKYCYRTVLVGVSNYEGNIEDYKTVDDIVSIIKESVENNSQIKRFIYSSIIKIFQKFKYFDQVEEIKSYLESKGIFKGEKYLPDSEIKENKTENFSSGTKADYSSGKKNYYSYSSNKKKEYSYGYHQSGFKKKLNMYGNSEFSTNYKENETKERYPLNSIYVKEADNNYGDKWNYEDTSKNWKKRSNKKKYGTNYKYYNDFENTGKNVSNFADQGIKNGKEI
ncbi:MAG: hypothetical protein MJ252_00670 [archaeon]|nr:hypothetical protein [archaeon]